MLASRKMFAELPDADQAQLEWLLWKFDQAWTPAALDVQVQELPSDDGHVRQIALVELIKIDIERQWVAGNRPTVEDYMERFPELGTGDTVPIELLAAEDQLRRECGVALELSDWERRFPGRVDDLASHLGAVAQASDGQSVTQASIDTSRRGETSDTRPKVAAKLTELPERFGRYRIIRRLGEGAMGAVYLAHDKELDRQVALKTPRFCGADGKEAVARFYQEARAAAALSHASICPVYDIGEIDGTHYISMAYVDGQPLAEHAKADGPFAEHEIALLVRKIALALEHAHAHGVIHRDLKPANIMMDQRREPVVMDFGLARRLDKADQERLTQPGIMMGSPAYMSPEQVKGQADRVGPASDIYSLGVILYELLTGEIPFRGSVANVLARIVTETPTRPSELRPGLSPRLESVCLKMMAKRVEDRYRSMQEVANALEQWLERPGISSTKVATGQRSVTSVPEPPKPRRLAQQARRVVWWAASAMILAFLLLTVVLLFRTPYGLLEIRVDDPELRVFVDGNQITLEERQATKRLKASTHRLVVKLGDTELPIDGSIKMTERDHGGGYRLAVRLDEAELMSDRFEIVRGGKRVLAIRLMPSPKPWRLGKPEGHLTKGRSSVSGRFVFGAFDGNQWDLFTYVPQTDELRNITNNLDRDERNPRFSPDGRWIAFQSNRGGFGGPHARFDVYVTDGSQTRRLTEQIGWAASGVAWSPDGKQILASVEQWGGDKPFEPWTNWCEVWRVSLDGKLPEVVPSLSKRGEFYHSLDWHRNGNLLMARFDAPLVFSDIYVTRLDGRKQLLRLTDTEYDNTDSRWSPDGKHIWFSSERTPAGQRGHLQMHRIYVMNADGSGVSPRFHETAVDMDPVPIEDGKRVAFIRSPRTAPRLMVGLAEASGAKLLYDLDSFEAVDGLDWTASAAPSDASTDCGLFEQQLP